MKDIFKLCRLKLLLVYSIYPTILSRQQKGFSYLEMIVAMFIMTIMITPAMNAIRSGVQGSGIHESLTRQHFSLVKRMEETQAEAYGNLLNAAQIAANKTTPSHFSDPEGQVERRLVYLALYDADVDPFILVDPDNDGDADIYTGDMSNLLWLRVTLENSTQSIETLISR